MRFAQIFALSYVELMKKTFITLRTFLKVLEEHAPMKQKVLRANDKPYMTKALRQAIMRRSTLKTKFLKNRSDDNHKAFKKQKNYTKRLAKKERVKYFANLDLNKYTDMFLHQVSLK